MICTRTLFRAAVIIRDINLTGIFRICKISFKIKCTWNSDMLTSFAISKSVYLLIFEGICASQKCLPSPTNSDKQIFCETPCTILNDPRFCC